jgi:nicotinamidase-related amidase
MPRTDFLKMLPSGHDVVMSGCETHVCVLQTVLGLVFASVSKSRPG